MRRHQEKRTELLKGAAVASTIAAILAVWACKSGRDDKLPVESLKSTAKEVIKDIRVPEPISAAEVNKLLADNERFVKDNIKKIAKTGRKVSKKLYKTLKKEATKQTKNIHGTLRK